MANICPSCSAPLDPEATLLNNVSTVGTTTSRCGNCGYVLPMQIGSNRDQDSAVAGESLPVSVGDTDVSQSGDEHGTVAPTVMPQSPSGTRRVGHFELVRVLGQGAFGAVWLAKDLNLGRLVALKLPTRSEKDSGLLREAQTAAKLTHPNIVSVFEVGEVAGQVFIASEFIDGRTLRAELREKRLESKRAIEVMAIVAEAAHYAHENRVVHRDMKPANVMVDKKGVPYITDFGIAKSIAEEETISLDGEVVGTIAYMAPEQASGKNHLTDRRADVYAMGVMLFELLTESRPFHGNAQGVLYQKTAEDAPSPKTLVPTLNRDLETICLKCLERDPDKRYQTALELAEELQRLQQNVPILARPVSSPEKAWRWCCRNPAVSGSLAFAFAVLVTGLLIVSHFWSDAVISEHQTRATLYRAHMNLAVTKMYEGEVTASRELIQRYDGDSSATGFIQNHVKTLSSLFLQIVNHGTRIIDVAISHDGKTFATAGKSEIRVWDTQDGALLRSLTTSSYEFRAIQFAPKDDRLLSACSDGVARIWNPTAHERVAMELQHGQDVTCVAFFPDRKRIITGSIDGTINIWELSTGELLTDELSIPGKPAEKIVFSNDGTFIGILASRGTTPKERSVLSVRIIDSESLVQTLETMKIPLMESLVFEEERDTFVVSTQGWKLFRFSMENDKPVTTAKGLQQPYGDITSVAGTNLLAVTSLNGATTLLDHELRVVRRLITHSKSFGIIDTSPDGSLMIVGSGDGTARLIDATAFATPESIWTDTVVRSLSFTKDGRSVAMACGDGALRHWSPFGNSLTDIVWQDARERAVLSVAVDQTTGQLAACGMLRELRVTEPDSNTIIAQTTLPFGGYSAVAWSADGQYIVVGGRSGQVLIFDSKKLSQPPAEYFRAEGVVNTICPVGRSNLLAVAWDDNKISLLDPKTGRIAREFPATASPPLSLAYAESEELLVVGTQMGRLYFYSTVDMSLRSTIRAHSALISGLAVFPDGKQLVSGGLDGVLNIWDIATGELQGQLPGHGSHRVFSVAVSPDGQTIASSGLEGDVRIWRSSAE